MTPQETYDACSAAGVRLRINLTDNKLTATPKRKLTPILLQELENNRAAIIELIEDRDGIGESQVIVEPPPPEPPQPSIAERIIAEADRQGFVIELDHPGPLGMVTVRPKRVRKIGIPDAMIDDVGAKMILSPVPVPGALGAQIITYMKELVRHLRAPYIPAAPAAPVKMTSRKRSIWERMANPDNLLPDAEDNQKHVRELLFGPNVDAVAQARREQQFNAVFPFVVNPVKDK